MSMAAVLLVVIGATILLKQNSTPYWSETPANLGNAFNDNDTNRIIIKEKSSGNMINNEYQDIPIADFDNVRKRIHQEMINAGFIIDKFNDSRLDSVFIKARVNGEVSDSQRAFLDKYHIILSAENTLAIKITEN